MLRAQPGRKQPDEWEASPPSKDWYREKIKKDEPPKPSGGKVRVPQTTSTGSAVLHALTPPVLSVCTDCWRPDARGQRRRVLVADVL